MRKFGFLGFFMVLALVFLGIGYAAWTDEVTVTSTVSTGEFSVEYVEDPECGQYSYCALDEIWDYAYALNYANGSYAAADGQGEGINYATLEVSAFDSKTVDITVGNVYPGTKWKVGLIIENKGTIPAVFDYADVALSGNPDLDNLLHATITESIDVITVEDGAIVSEYSYTWNWSTVANLQDNLNEILDDARLEPGQQMCIRFIHKLPITVDNDDMVEDVSLDYNVTLNFRQHNVLDTELS